MTYTLEQTLPDYYGTPPTCETGPCDQYGTYRPGDPCPLHTYDAICAVCGRHVNFDAFGASEYAIHVWGFRDPEPSALDGVMTSGPEWWCPECVASFELSGDVLRCRECGDAFHPDMENVHGGACDDCREKGQ